LKLCYSNTVVSVPEVYSEHTPGALVPSIAYGISVLDKESLCDYSTLP